MAGCSLYVVHVSCKEAIDPIARAKELGWNAHGETCTQYFFVDETFLERPDFEGAKYVYTPPPRAKENQEHLWRAVATDILSVVSTDHCPSAGPTRSRSARRLLQDPERRPGDRGSADDDPRVRRAGGRISLNRMVELLATNPAKYFGLYPRKGTVAVGSDADIVVFDPDKRVTLSAERSHSRVDYNLYEGTEVTGAGGRARARKVIVEGGELVGQPGDGRFVKRARFGEQLTARGRSGVALLATRFRLACVPHCTSFSAPPLMMAFHPPVHTEFVLALRVLDAFGMPYAEAWRLLRPVAARLGIPRPSYSTVRRIVIAERKQKGRTWSFSTCSWWICSQGGSDEVRGTQSHRGQRVGGRRASALAGRGQAWADEPLGRARPRR